MGGAFPSMGIFKNNQNRCTPEAGGPVQACPSSLWPRSIFCSKSDHRTTQNIAMQAERETSFSFSGSLRFLQQIVTEVATQWTAAPCPCCPQRDSAAPAITGGICVPLLNPGRPGTGPCWFHSPSCRVSESKRKADQSSFPGRWGSTWSERPEGLASPSWAEAAPADQQAEHRHVSNKQNHEELNSCCFQATTHMPEEWAEMMERWSEQSLWRKHPATTGDSPEPRPGVGGNLNCNRQSTPIVLQES